MDRKFGTSWFRIGGHGQEFYVKHTTFPTYGSSMPNVTISVGGIRSFCVIIAIKSESVAYIDRVEFDEFCSATGILQENKGIETLLKCAMWFVFQRYPSIRRFTLEDDSHIYCVKKSKQHKLSLSYDYILKYGQTWYEKKLGATLPDIVVSDYKKSQDILDKEITPFEIISKDMTKLKAYEDIYRKAKTPREFITSLRTSMGSHTYCMEVGKWLTQYMELLNVQIFKRDWFIPTDSLKEPEGYTMKELQDEPKMGGGKRIKTRKQRVPRKPLTNGGGIGYIDTLDE